MKGFCPSFVTIEGGTPKKSRTAKQALPAQLDDLPEVAVAELGETTYNILITGIGGTGVITIGALLGMAAHLEGKGTSALDMTGMSQKNGSVTSHVRIAQDAEQLHAARIAAGQADAVLACDMVVAAGAEARATMRRGYTRALVNTAQTITGDFVRHPDQVFPSAAMQQSLRDSLSDAAEFVDAGRLATLLLGHSIATNMFMLGFAWQRGWVPVSRAALMRSIELNAVAVAENQLAFQWGRRAACDPEGIERLAAQAETAPAGRRISQGLDEVIARRREFLVAYQSEAYAQGYVQLVESVRLAEAGAVQGSTRLAECVARSAFTLMACKDEYEVARLFGDTEFERALRAEFDGDIRIRLHLAIPMFSRADPVTGEVRKRSYGPWILPALRLLARLKVLRATPFDLFGRSAERRLERTLAADYARTVRALMADLRADNHQLACEIASLPEHIRGFGEVKQRNAAAARQRQQKLMSDWPRPTRPAAS